MGPNPKQAARSGAQGVAKGLARPTAAAAAVAALGGVAMAAAAACRGPGVPGSACSNSSWRLAAALLLLVLSALLSPACEARPEGLPSAGVAGLAGLRPVPQPEAAGRPGLEPGLALGAPGPGRQPTAVTGNAGRQCEQASCLQIWLHGCKSLKLPPRSTHTHTTTKHLCRRE